MFAGMHGCAAWPADGHWAVFGEAERVVQHDLQLLGARRREHTHTRHLGQQREVVHAVVTRSVRACNASAVETEDDRQTVQCHVVDHLIPGAIEERGVDGNDGSQAAQRHSRSTGDGVLFGDTDVVETIGEARLERQQSRRARHRGGDGHDTLVEFGFLDDPLGEGLCVPGDYGGWRTNRRVEDRRVVQMLLVVVLGWRVAATLLGEDVHHDRTLSGELYGIAERLLELLDVVTVDRADVPHAERLEE
ncbi:unannotated protein [freshwater metagenome]|uniref:Unannotated protein n=1 Tax=freshwater metagenome TaxID=449393 RepID=A0A6J7AKR9_9ZZZZ